MLHHAADWAGLQQTIHLYSQCIALKLDSWWPALGTWKTLKNHCSRNMQKGSERLISCSERINCSSNILKPMPCSVLFCNPNWASRTYNFEMVSTCVNYQLPEYENWPLPEQPKHDANTLTWKVSLLSWLELIIYLEWYIYMYIYYITVCICVYIYIYTYIK